MEQAGAALEELSSSRDPEAAIGAAEARLAAVDDALRGTPGLCCLQTEPDLAGRVFAVTAQIWASLEDLERRIYAEAGERPAAEVEKVRVALVAVKDRLWAIDNDRLGNAQAVFGLAGPVPTVAALEAYASIQAALGAIDRLEVRGRDSAGLHVLVWDHDVDLGEPELAAQLQRRGDGNFTTGTVRVDGGVLGFVYKAAAEIGELGDNVAALRQSILNDSLLRRALTAPGARATVVGHTRWASVGTISEANAHPLDALERSGDTPGPGHQIAVLNGDIDNFESLKARYEMDIPGVITTDAKAIPVLVGRRLAQGLPVQEAFASAVSELEGSVAIALSSAREPNRLHMAVRGSGQGLYVGLADDLFIVASEPYGVIEEAGRYLRVDGDSGAGRLVTLDADKAGTLEGIQRSGYDGQPFAVAEKHLQEPEITTRDIDRKGFRHFLLKEITEAPESFRKTLRGRVVRRDGGYGVSLDRQAIPDPVRCGLRDGRYRRVLVIGQGTAAIAGRAVAEAIERALAPLDVSVDALTACELSGFRLEDDMRDTLVVAISQSGTTTDTNRTVDLASARGATVLAIVNRRNTDLVEKSVGVVYTSDGRDVEMSVASTKAFYSQVAAGFLLSVALAEAAGCGTAQDGSDLLDALVRLPEAMSQVLAQRDCIADIAGRHASRRRHWAVVGSGPNRSAAAEVRIKLSELCYKSVACDSIEDKKHIDLSAEPLILVCAAGLAGANAADAEKEVAIYRAHKAAPVVIASAGKGAFESEDTVFVPEVDPRVDFVLSAMVGHLFGYEAALAIDSLARPLREIRSAVQELASAGLTAGAVLVNLGPRIEAPARRWLDQVSSGDCDGVLSLGPAAQLGLMVRCAMGELPFEVYEIERGAGAGPKAFLDEFVAGLTKVIDDLTRSVDAVKHQAKTVTVGISRSEDGIFGVKLVQEVMRIGAGTEELGYRSLRSLAALDPAVEAVTGFTRYVVAGEVRSPEATIHVVDRGGLGAELRSRTDDDPRLRGTKRAALERSEVEVTVGRSDGRPVILVPERKGDLLQGLTLLHIEFRDRLDPSVAREVLRGYRSARYEGLVAAVTETEETFAEELLGELSMPELLVEPVLDLAERWRSG